VRPVMERLRGRGPASLLLERSRDCSALKLPRLEGSDLESLLKLRLRVWSLVRLPKLGRAHRRHSCQG